ncbi:MAG TPA: class I SAM-dependent methyltransferase [Magnetospirillum sp.]|nr:class I SAM-dependent methyltransferase [Magnetospirillum sp.]
MNPQDHLIRQTDIYDFDSIVDIGTGTGAAARHFAGRCSRVLATGYDMASYLGQPLPSTVQVLAGEDVCSMAAIGDGEMDAVWCAHVLEHVPDTGRALAEIRRILRPGGWLFLSLPEYSPFVVGGHVTPGWNLGILMYALILAGFNVRDGAFVNHCWNVTAFVQRGEPVSLPLRHDRGDIETLAPLFPKGLQAHQGMDGDMLRLNWEWAPAIAAEAERAFGRAVWRRRLHGLVPPALRHAVRAAKLKGRG